MSNPHNWAESSLVEKRSSSWASFSLVYFGPVSAQFPLGPNFAQSGWAQPI